MIFGLHKDCLKKDGKSPIKKGDFIRLADKGLWKGLGWVIRILGGGNIPELTILLNGKEELPLKRRISIGG